MDRLAKSLLMGTVLVAGSMNYAVAQCIVTNQNFDAASEIFYVNEFNGSDDLGVASKLAQVQNPYQPRSNVVRPFQSIDKVLSMYNQSRGDIVLLRRGSQWIQHDFLNQTASRQFNQLTQQAAQLNQKECQANQDFTWVTPVIEQQQATPRPTVTQFVADTDELVLANLNVSPAPTAQQNNSDLYQNASLNSRSSGSGGGAGSSSGGGGGAAGNHANNDFALSLGTDTNPFQYDDSSYQQLAQNSQYSNDGSGGTRNDSVGETVPPANNPTPPIDNSVPPVNNSTPPIDNSVPSVNNPTPSIDNSEPPVNDSTPPIDNPGSPSETSEQVVPDDTDAPPVNNGGGNSGSPQICKQYAEWESQIQRYPVDKDGWSIIKPDSETRIVYVSSSTGSDNYARPYTNSELGGDPFNPVGNIQAYRTIEEAYKQIRNGKPDWILLKKGDRFELADRIWLKSGKSQNAHAVIGSYGDKNAARPFVDTHTSTALRVNDVQFITVIGIEFYASGRDPGSSRFVGWSKVEDASGISIVVGKPSSGIHLENNRLSYYSIGIGLQSMTSDGINGAVVRRNQVLNSYSVTAHSQGMYFGRVQDVLVEENLFDHNGWYQQRPSSIQLNTKSYGYATFFNHNVYISNSSNLVIRRNLSSRSSSIGMKFTSNSDRDTKIDTVNSENIYLDSNLIVEGEVGFSIGGNTDFNNGYRWDNMHVVNNVLTNVGRSRPTNRNLSFNIEANDWKVGSICGNYIVDRDDKTLTTRYGIEVNGHTESVAVSKNRVINFGIKEESYAQKSVVNNSENRYVPELIDVNYLNRYVKSKGYFDYAAYIVSIIEKLKNNSSSYYNVDDAIKYIQLQADY